MNTKGITKTVVYQAAFAFDEELVSPQALPSYIAEKESFLVRVVEYIGQEMDKDRLELRALFNEFRKKRGLVPIPDDATYEPQKETSH
jgi:hypothetical protein